MPSQPIISACSRIVQQQLLPQIPARWQHQFKFGIQALTLKPFSSLASNGRQTVAHPDTAGTKMDRLVNNEPLTEAMSLAVAGLGFIRPDSIVACDHSDFNGLSAFVGAVQTRKGRAIPCLVATTYSPRLPAHDQAPKRKQQMRRARRELSYDLYGQVATSLETWASQIGFWPRLVFDRGFGGLTLIQMLASHDATFYIRLKAGRQVELDGKKLQVRMLSSADATIRLGDMTLRVVRSDDPESGEPWYILTSDRTLSREQIIRIYYHRFEIEETFKDLKHVLDLEQTRLTKPLSLKVLLWFASLGLILSFLLGWWAAPHRRQNPKKVLSHYKQFFESLQRAAYRPLATLITGGL